MNTLTANPARSPDPVKPRPALEAARAACQRIAPLWPLQNFVAVNPFVGLADRPFIDACDLVRRIAPGGMQMPMAFYAEKFAAGEIIDADLSAALASARSALTGRWTAQLVTINESVLKGALEDGAVAESGDEILSVAEAVDVVHGTSWAAAVTETIAQFCSEYYDAGQSAWRLPWRGLPLYNAWREKAGINLNAEMLGLRGFRQWVKTLPPDAEEAVGRTMSAIGVSEADAADYFHRLLMSIRGWAGHVQYRVRENSPRSESDDSLLHLLAVRLAYDAALLKQYDSPAMREVLKPGQNSGGNLRVLSAFLWQLAHEQAWQRKLLGELRLAARQPRATPPAVQAVFCIDVRSEILRRALESTSDRIETLGFAGFFGMPIESIPFGQHVGTAQCPVLLAPKFRVRETLRHAGPQALEAAWQRQRRGKRLAYSWNAFKSSAISCFSFVETAGLAFGPKLFRDAFVPPATRPKTGLGSGPQLDTSAADGTGIPPDDRIPLALGALRHMGLTKNFARLVLLCGHGSETVNNPYAAGLDCGACGGW